MCVCVCVCVFVFVFLNERDRDRKTDRQMVRQTEAGTERMRDKVRTCIFMLPETELQLSVKHSDETVWYFHFAFRYYLQRRRILPFQAL